jgi:hypothetical protein
MAGAPPEHFVFEEAAGLVVIDLMYEGGILIGADLLSPQALVRHAEVDAARAAKCLGPAGDDVCTDAPCSRSTERARSTPIHAMPGWTGAVATCTRACSPGEW